MIWGDLILFILSCVVLARAGSWVVKGLTKISKALNLGEFVIGFVIMSFATTLPELFVSITGSIAGAGGLVIGNIIGSNIANLSLVLGVGILILKGVDVESEAVRKDAVHMFLIILLPLLLMFDRTLSRIDGFILIGMFFIFLYKVFKERQRITEKKYENHTFKELFNNSALTFISIVLLLISANFVVKYGTKLAVNIGVTEILIGLIFVAIGTSLPELTFHIMAALKGHHRMGLGNIIGAVILNSTLCLGIAALIRPITSDFVLFLSSAVFLIVLAFVFITFIESENRLSLKEGISLLFFYILFLVVELGVKGIVR